MAGCLLVKVVESGANNAKVVSSTLTQATTLDSSTLDVFANYVIYTLLHFERWFSLQQLLSGDFVAKERLSAPKTERWFQVQLMPGLFFKTYTTFLQTSIFLSPNASSECDIICILWPRSPMDGASHFD